MDNEATAMITSRSLILLGVAALVGGCHTVPPGPSMMVLPGSRTSFEQFQLCWLQI